MDKEKLNLDLIIKNLEQIITSGGQFEEKIDQLSREISKGKQENEKFSEEKIKGLLQICLKNTQKLEQIQPKVQLFQQKVFYRNKKHEFEDIVIMPIRSQQSGLVEHGIVEQIEMIDDHMKGNYQKLHEMMCHRICYMNKTVDACLDYLKQNI